jgi:hypothetical protein
MYVVNCKGVLVYTARGDLFNIYGSSRHRTRVAISYYPGEPLVRQRSRVTYSSSTITKDIRSI